jgi:rod shape-determining protein MreB
MPFRFSLNWLSIESVDMAIDLGTTTTLIYAIGEGIVLEEDSMVALESKTRKMITAGKEVKGMLGRTPEDITIIKPMEDGVIADFKVVEEMLRYFVKNAQKRKLFLRPRVVVAVPSGITPVEKRAVINSVEESGAREVFLVSEPIAAALGVGLPVKEPAGNMIIDIGGGTTEIAVIAMSGIVNKVSIKIAGNELDEAIQVYMYDKYNLSIGKVTAENIKKTIGSAHPSIGNKEMEVRGRDLIAGIPTKVVLDSEEIRDAMREPLGLIKNAIKKALSETPPELASDILERGLTLTGGGALLSGIDQMIHGATGIRVTISEDPLRCVVKGAGIVLENMDNYRELLMNLE